ncbi:Gfo/Idh/MocA family protein [Peribacillus huizhouensis]|uniref:Dehydrogenase n=1 Tax=Peribacillus huizhouensis TaxID=1501239 RepID=A0ABR6CJR5_9BACI|nr:Gfo/Idh/MocA family oxidoreductase [Peribacillus huizhouensis]MBA9025134.1 putative dehydrogenase [Peribacillus huizhouensis]
MIRFGIVGTNWITERLLEAAGKHDDFVLKAVFSRTEDRAREFAAKYDADLTFTDLNEMAASEEIDAVYIATPNSYHSEQSILFMKHGKHVLCEKPLAANAKEVKAMIESAKSNNVVLMEAMKSTVMPNFQVIQDNLDKLGKIRTFFANYCQYSSRYDAYKNGTVLNAFNPEFSTGALMDLGVYTIYPLVALFGKPNTIKAQGYILGTGTDAQGSILLDYDGMQANVMYSKITDTTLPSEIHGEDATMVIQHISSPEKIEIRYRDGSIEDVSIQQEMEPMYYEVAEFIQLIQSRENESTLNAWDTSLHVMEIMDEARKQIGVRFPND